VIADTSDVSDESEVSSDMTPVDEPVRLHRRGRPSLSGDHSESPQITFRLPPELRAQVEVIATREGRRMSDIARDALQRYLEAS
jgi:hypothetical protein